MKKLILLLVVFLSGIVCFAQGIENPVNPPVLNYITTFAGAVLLVNLITGWLKTLLKWQGNAAKYLSWAVAVLISLLGTFLNLGIFEPLTWWQSLIYAFGIGLAANGAFKTEVIQQILIFLMAQIKPKN